MASNKNQHFVPKVCLRPFSSDVEQASINLFNLKRQNSIPRASIKGQCASNYFYGEDGKLEKALQNPEGEFGKFLIELAEQSFHLEERHELLLRRFCFLQYLRTDAQRQRTMGFMTAMADAAFNGETPPEYRPDPRETTRFAIEIFFESKHLIDDLKVRLIRNQTETDFITSDDPSVHTNRWHLQNPKAAGKSPGISSAGVVFLMPLTPRFVCLMYDGDTYTVDHKNGFIEAAARDEIDRLNEHQYLNCQENVYFADWSSKERVEEAFKLVADRRVVERHKVVVGVLESENEWGQEFKVVPHGAMEPGATGMVHVKDVMPVPTRWPRLLRMRNKPRIYSNNTGTGFVRAWSLANGGYTGTGYKKIKP